MNALVAFLVYVTLVAPLGAVLVAVTVPSWVVVIGARKLARAGRAVVRLVWRRA